MGDLQFNYQADEFRRRATAPQADMTDRLIQWGVAKNREQAQYILWGVIAVSLCITMFFSRHLIFGSPPPVKDTTTPWPITAPPSPQK